MRPDLARRMIDASDDTLGGRLSAARDASGISQADLANRLGVRRETLTAWETDRAEPRSSRLIDIAGILGVSPMWLMTGNGLGPAVEDDSLLLEAMRVELARLSELHHETGRLIDGLARQVERFESVRLRR